MLIPSHAQGHHRGRDLTGGAQLRFKVSPKKKMLNALIVST